MKKFLFLLATSMILILAACSGDDTSGGDEESDAKPDPDDIGELIPEMSDYSDEEQEKIKQGRDIMNNTEEMLPDNVGNRLACASCHAQGGQGKALTLVGVDKEFPQYSKREGEDITLKDRINGCFMRSMDGNPLDEDSEEMESLVSWMEYISDGVESGDEYEFMAQSHKMDDIPYPDIDDGQRAFERHNCSSCHGMKSVNVALSGPELYGDGSFNDGAGLSRFSDFAGFIQKFMPFNDPGTLSDQEASDIAAYILMKDRPEFEGENKFPDGGKPDDYMDAETREKLKNNTIDFDDFEKIEDKK